MILSFFKYLNVLVLCVPVLMLSQQRPSFETDWEGDVNTSITEYFSLNIGATYRNRPIEEIGETPLATDSRHFQLSVNISREVGFFGKLGGGLMYRFNTVGETGMADEFRATQQYSYGRRYNASRFVHRLKADQRFFKSMNTVHRLRYRLSFDSPLRGLKLDPGEFYVVVSAETLLNLARNRGPAWDQRLTAGLGNQLLDKMKVQLDVEYRMESFNLSTVKRIFLYSGLVYDL